MQEEEKWNCGLKKIIIKQLIFQSPKAFVNINTHSELSKIEKENK